MEQELRCRLTGLFFYDPVLACDGYVYEQFTLKEFLSHRRVSPMTGQPMSDKVYPVKKIKDIVDKLMEEKPELKEQRYFYKKPYHLFRPEILNIITTEEYDKLVDYDCFLITEYYTFMVILAKEISFDIFKYIIDHSIDYDTYNNQSGEKLIHVLCKQGTPEKINYLIDKQIDLNIVDANGYYPLDLVLLHQTNKFDIVKKMIDNGAKLTYDKATPQPIHYLMKNIDFEILKLFKEHNIDLEHTTPNGVRPIHILCLYGTKDNILEGFNQGMNLEAKINSTNETCLDRIYNNKVMTETERYQTLFVYLDKVLNKSEIVENFYDCEKISSNEDSNYN